MRNKYKKNFFLINVCACFTTLLFFFFFPLP